jgi:NAD(P)H-flavin reductase
MAATIATSPEPFRVIDRRQETEDTWTLRLRPHGSGGFEFEPGQFTMLYAFGSGEVPISMSGNPAEPGTLVHTVRAVGSVTRKICEASEGEMLGVRGPFGRGWPVGEARGRDLVIVAGGLGLAPLRPALYAAVAERERFDRVVLLYGGRRPDQLLFRDELREWTDHPEIEYAAIVDAADDSWRGRVGVVPSLIERAGLDAANTVALACGPEVMMRFSVEALLDAGVEPGRIFISMERNMRCAVGQCGHCQFGPMFVCRDGPVFAWPEIERLFSIREV